MTGVILLLSYDFQLFCTDMTICPFFWIPTTTRWMRWLRPSISNWSTSNVSRLALVPCVPSVRWRPTTWQMSWILYWNTHCHTMSKDILYWRPCLRPRLRLGHRLRLYQLFGKVFTLSLGYQMGGRNPRLRLGFKKDLSIYFVLVSCVRKCLCSLFFCVHTSQTFQTCIVFLKFKLQKRTKIHLEQMGNCMGDRNQAVWLTFIFDNNKCQCI